MNEKEEKFHLHVAANGVLEVSSAKSVPAWKLQVRVSYYEKSSDGTMIGRKQTLDTTKGDLIAEIEMWEEKPKPESLSSLESEGSV